LSVARGLQDQFELHLVSAEPAHAYASQTLPDAPFHMMSRATIMGDRHWWHRARNVAIGTWDARRVIATVRPDAIVCVATSMAVPLCLVGKMYGITTVFVESITRVAKPSSTGTILTRLGICDRFYVQWPEAAKLYPNALFKGSVL
jgi:UDP-N-acetylglucosamine:LPS N-acetylglucosamine transferase